MGAISRDPFLWIHATWFLASLLSGLILWARPRPRVALAILMVMHSVAFLAYYRGLQRPYAVGVSNDRSLGLGMALAVADGGSPFHHVQVEFGNLEPLWTFTVAALSGFSRAFVPWVYDHMTLAVLILTALGFYVGWRGRAGAGDDPDAASWRGVLVAASVLGLSSHSLTADLPVFAFWQSNFVFKPNHSLAFGLVGLLSGGRLASERWLKTGALMALLFWVFILDWAYLLPGLLFVALQGSDRAKGMRRWALAAAFSLVAGLPYLLHLLRDYNPVAKGEMPQIWRDDMGGRFSDPYWWSLDLGLVWVLFLVAIVLAARPTTRDPGLGFLLSALLVALAYVIGFRVGFAPEPDEGYYYLRMAAGAGTGLSLWFLARRLSSPTRRFYSPAFAVILMFSFPARFNPMDSDPFYGPSLEPVQGEVLAVTNWVATHTTVRAVIISADGIMLSGLTGRRFLMVRPDQTNDRNDRERAERDIMTSLDEAKVRRAVDRYGVTHVIVEQTLREKYPAAALKGLGNRPWFEPVFANSYARVLAIRKPA